MIDFSHEGKEYTLVEKETENGYAVTIREKDTGLFVKSFPSLTDQQFKWYTKNIERGGTGGLYKIDFDAMRALEYIEQATAANNQAPTFAEIALALGISTPAVLGLLVRLERYGCIQRTYYKPRGIQLLKRRAEM